jgi:hypothetical protein
LTEEIIYLKRLSHMHCVVRYCAVLCCAVLQTLYSDIYTVLHCAVSQYSDLLDTAMHSTALCSAISYNHTLYALTGAGQENTYQKGRRTTSHN